MENVLVCIHKQLVALVGLEIQKDRHRAGVLKLSYQRSKLRHCGCGFTDPSSFRISGAFTCDMVSGKEIVFSRIDECLEGD